MVPWPRSPFSAGTRNIPPFSTTDAGAWVVEGEAVRSKKQVVTVGVLLSGVAQDVESPAAAASPQNHRPEIVAAKLAKVFNCLLFMVIDSQTI